MRKTIGILAHVDAGKTTFSETVLYEAGVIRKKGRVDHQDTFLDTDPMEMARGITIFSGQAVFPWQDDTIYWLDTPGHADFSAEMERAVSVMDAAIVVISAADGVQPHTETVWQILAEHRVPTFLFINKCDRRDVTEDMLKQLLDRIRARLSPAAADLRGYSRSRGFSEAMQEEIAGLDEDLMARYFDGQYDASLWLERLGEMLRARVCFPVMAGSALTGDGVRDFLDLVCSLTRFEPLCLDHLSASIYRIRHESSGLRLCFMKLRSGTLRVKDTIPCPGGPEKVNEIRIYSGQRYQSVQQAQPGDLIALPLTASVRPGDALGGLEPQGLHTTAMTQADLLWDASLTPPYQMAACMRMLEDEDPSLGLDENGDHLSVRVIGPMQLDILTEQIRDRFGIVVTFGPPRILYHETVAAPVIGIGHYEPLRHYAEVHLRLSPAPRGSGVLFRSFAHVDDLALSWQRLIATHVREKEHKGVLTGSPLTDVYVDLLCGRAHLKHTEGGDFRQAVYRAIRNALMQAESVLLEPVCAFEIRVSADLFGTIQGDLVRLRANCEPPQFAEETVVFRGTCVYADFFPYQSDFSMRTHGSGMLRVYMDHEEPCARTEQVVHERNYKPLADDTPDSVFCSHGAGFTVAWDHVRDFAHLPSPAPEEIVRETPLYG